MKKAHSSNFRNENKFPGVGNGNESEVLYTIPASSVSITLKGMRMTGIQ